MNAIECLKEMVDTARGELLVFSPKVVASVHLTTNTEVFLKSNDPDAPKMLALLLSLAVVALASDINTADIDARLKASFWDMEKAAQDDTTRND